MLDDSSKTDEEMGEIKRKLTILMNSEQDIYERFKDLFGIEPVQTVKEIMLKIGSPLERLKQMYELIKHITANLKSSFQSEIEAMQANTYLMTTPTFEKLFNISGR